MILRNHWHDIAEGTGAKQQIVKCFIYRYSYTYPESRSQLQDWEVRDKRKTYGLMCPDSCSI